MSGRRVLAPCSFCHRHQVLEQWHECCCGVYRCGVRNATTAIVEWLAVPRAVAAPALEVGRRMERER